MYLLVSSLTCDCPAGTHGEQFWHFAQLSQTANNETRQKILWSTRVPFSKTSYNKELHKTSWKLNQVWLTRIKLPPRSGPRKKNFGSHVFLGLVVREQMLKFSCQLPLTIDDNFPDASKTFAQAILEAQTDKKQFLLEKPPLTSVEHDHTSNSSALQDFDQIHWIFCLFWEKSKLAEKC